MSLWFIRMLTRNYRWVRLIPHVDKYKTRSQLFIHKIHLKKSKGFNLPKGEEELVAGYQTEYLGIKFGLFYVGSNLNLLVPSSFVTLNYLGEWDLSNCSSRNSHKIHYLGVSIVFCPNRSCRPNNIGQHFLKLQTIC